MKKKQQIFIKVGNNVFGSGQFIIIAGPCAVESETQMIETARFLKKTGISIMRASLFKPRTSPYSFQGLGLDGLKILKKVKEETGILLESEVVDIQSMDALVQHADILRIGTRNMTNLELIQAIGHIKKPVILKRGFASTLDELIRASELIRQSGNDKVILCERGIRTFETAYRNTLDIAAIEILKSKTGLPMIVDPSHAAGKRDLVPSLSKAAVAAGADGLIIEMHPDPDHALSDGPQSLYPHQLQSLFQEIQSIKKALSNLSQ